MSDVLCATSSSLQKCMEKGGGVEVATRAAQPLELPLAAAAADLRDLARRPLSASLHVHPPASALGEAMPLRAAAEHCISKQRSVFTLSRLAKQQRRRFRSENHVPRACNVVWRRRGCSRPSGAAGTLSFGWPVVGRGST
jgi:hypothetical protein